MERAVLRALPWLVAGLVASALLLALPRFRENLLLLVTVHLSALVVFALAMALDLAPLLADQWWDGLSRWGRRLASGAWLAALVTGTVALVTLASSAALRLEPSLQYLQLLAAAGIAWTVATQALGLRLLVGRRLAVVGGGAIGALGVWAIWRYLGVVGFTAEGGWLLVGLDLWRYVLPYGLAAGLTGMVVLVAGSLRQIELESAAPPPRS